MRITCDSHAISRNRATENLGKYFTQGNPERAAQKRTTANCIDSQAAVARLAVPYVLSLVHRMRYNQRAVKKVLVVAKIDVKLAVPMEMETNVDDGSRSGTSG